MSEAGCSNSPHSCDARTPDCQFAITVEVIVRINQMKQTSWTARMATALAGYWCPERESNPHTLSDEGF